MWIFLWSGMNRILLCVDGSEYTEPACHYAAWWASRVSAQIEILYVSDLRSFEIPAFADLSGSLGVQPYQGVAVQIQEMEQRKAGVIEERCVALLMEAGCAKEDLVFTHLTGFLVDTLQERQEDCYGLVMGKRGENADFAKGHLGSMMERVVRCATRPVFVTARKFMPIQRVLLAYDGSASAQKALWSLMSGDLLKNAELCLVTVAEDREAEQYASSLREAESQLVAAGIPADCQILGGEPEDAIAAFVEEQGIDLLVIGAYGHSRLRHFFIGSTTSEMMRGCKVPVLCFR